MNIHFVTIGCKSKIYIRVVFKENTCNKYESKCSNVLFSIKSLIITITFPRMYVKLQLVLCIPLSK